jgi:hypothetical protein
MSTRHNSAPDSTAVTGCGRGVLLPTVMLLCVPRLPTQRHTAAEAPVRPDLRRLPSKYHLRVIMYHDQTSGLTEIYRRDAIPMLVCSAAQVLTDIYLRDGMIPVLVCMAWLGTARSRSSSSTGSMGRGCANSCSRTTSASSRCRCVHLVGLAAAQEHRCTGWKIRGSDWATQRG